MLPARAIPLPLRHPPSPDMPASGSAKRFPTRYGYCQIFPDRIELVREDATGRLLARLYARGRHRSLLVYFMLFCGFLLGAAVAILIENYFLFLFLGFFTVISLFGMWENRDVSFASVIPREAIERGAYHPAVEGQARAGFTLWFRKDGRLFRRKISLPSILHHGQSIAEAAVRIMREEGLVSQEPD